MKNILFIFSFLGMLFWQSPVFGQVTKNNQKAQQHIADGNDLKKQELYVEATKRYLLAYDYGDENLKETALQLINDIAMKQNEIIAEKKKAVADLELANKAANAARADADKQRNEKEIQRKRAVENKKIAEQKGLQVEALRLPLLADSLLQAGHPDALKIAFLGLELSQSEGFQPGWKPFTKAFIQNEEYRERLSETSDNILFTQKIPQQNKLLVQTQKQIEIVNESTEETIKFPSFISPFTTPIFTPNGQIMAFQTSENDVEIWNINTLQKLETLRHTAPIRVLTFSKNGDCLLSAGRDQHILLYDLTTQQKNTFSGQNGSIYDLQMLPDNRHFIARSADGMVQLWDKNSQTANPLGKAEIYVYDAQISPNGIYILTSSITGLVKIWNSNGTLHKALPLQKNPVRKCYFFPDNQHFLTQSKTTVKLWNLDGQMIKELPVSSPKGIQINQQGSHFVLWDTQNQLILFDKKGSNKTVLQGHEAAIIQAEFSPNDQYLLTTSKDGKALLWENTGNLLANWNLQNFQPTPAFFSPTGDAVYITEATTIQRYPMPQKVYQELLGDKKNIIEYLKGCPNYQIQFLDKME